MTATPLKVLVAHNAYQQRGGEDAVVEAEIGLLRSFGHEVVEYYRDNAWIDGARRLEVLAHTLWSRSTEREIAQLIQIHTPNVIHVHNTFPLISPSIYWIAAQMGVPIVQSLHNFRLLCAQATFLRNDKPCEDCLGKLPWRGVTRKCYRGSAAQSAALVSMLALHRSIGSFRDKVARYITLSEFSKQKFAEGGLPKEKLSVKPNFVAAPPPSLGQRSGGLFVGRLSPEKGLGVLIQALERSSAACTVIGSGPQRALAETHPSIRLLGWLDSEGVRECMSKAAYLVLPSIAYEQFPRVLAEAFASGLPIVASRLGSLVELIEDGRTGLLFEPGSAEDLATKIKFAEDNPQRMRNMGQNARAEYEQKYTPERNYQQLMAIYAAAMSPAHATKSRALLNSGH
jgi:glycosyltransferase involved in cell wall biosynthesis